jgi:CheY-like chemotaxis protein
LGHGTLWWSTLIRTLPRSRLPPREGLTMSTALILLVDTDLDSRIIFHFILEHAGFHVLEARTAEEGLLLAREQRPRVVVTEFPLPIPGHACLAAAIRTDPALSSTVIIAVTAHALADVREQALRAGVDVFLTKPIEPSRLLREIERVLVPPAAPA